jgi:HEPN domain-containing protein
MLEDLRIACQLYRQNSDKPESLMLALYHAQQASEKAIKLFLVLTGLIEDSIEKISP